ncbi:MAG TPA: HIT family protein [Pyrinomonadaceae bacterium]|jgi:histidine triad (HIT) family protein|nr:HIT family protein [Pyrinomonadaceae bacterium]
MSNRHCIFCDITERVESSFIVFENSHAIVFLDKHPIHVGHVLAVPKHHVESFYELDEKSFVELMLVVRRMASVLEASYMPRKVGMLAAGFDVPHAHIHVLPMYDYHDITSRVILEGRRGNPSEKELQMAADHIKQRLLTQDRTAI